MRATKRIFLIWLLALAIGFPLLAVTGIRINLTDSLPLVFYRMTPGEVERGSLVVACPDLTNPVVQVARERGYIPTGWLTCDGGVAPLMKYVMALPGDLVEVVQEGVRVNGQAIENSARLVADSVGRPLPSLTVSGEVPSEHVWLLSDYTSASFDSRYFGPVKTSDIIGTETPLLVPQ